MARKKDQRVGEIEVERDEATILRTATINQITIQAPFHALGGDSGNIVPGSDEYIVTAQPKVLVEL